MLELRSFYPEIRQMMENCLPSYIPQLKLLVDAAFEESYVPTAILPLAACQAVGGDPRTAVPIAAALIANMICVRVLDDLIDKDRRDKLWNRVGDAHTYNYAAAMHILSFEILSKSPLSSNEFRGVNQFFIDAFFYLALGQQHDIEGKIDSVDAYWTIMELKSGNAYAAACASGALVGALDTRLVQACYTFGYHIGLAIQIFNDLESIWQPNGITDLKQGKITLPLIYGLQSDHPDRELLTALFNENRIVEEADLVKEILDKIDTKTFLVWAALKERDQALEALEICPDNQGKATLESFATAMFGDIDELLTLE